MSDPVPTPPPSETKLTWKEIAVGLYALIAIGAVIWGWQWGPEHYRGFFYNFGRGLVWPFWVFPGLGKIVGGIVVLIIVLGALASGSRKNN